MKLHFLQAALPLVKSYTKLENGYKKTSYPMVQRVTSHLENVSDPREFFAAVQYHAKNNHCLLKGRLSKKLHVESRAGKTNAMERTGWLCLDLDYLQSESQVDTILDRLGLGSTTYIRQYGAGHGIDKDFSAHLFFMLEREVLPEQLKFWLMHHNLSIPNFERSIQLARSNAALRWPLDISVAHNHMLIYIAAPDCKNFDDPVKGTRIDLIEKDHDTVDLLDRLNEIDPEVVEQQKATKLNSLREAKGLKPRKFTTKLVSGIEILSKPGIVTVTSQREGRGFMYLNLNGGDSWGYYHPVDNPEILYNFKGEPNYLIKELLPEYYKNYRALLRQLQREEQGELLHLAFLDRATDQYFRGTYDPKKKKTEVFQTSSVKKVEDFLRQHGQYVPDYIEEWDYVFRFDESRICIPEEKFINRYQETKYLAEGKLADRPKHFPPTILKILHSVIGDDKRLLGRLMNWLAFIIQKRRMTKTSWVFTGIEGTGKGLLMNKILAPIVGRQAVQVKLMSELEDNFNAYMEECVFLMIDEAEHRQLHAESRTMARLKNAITDEDIPIRRMNTGHYTAKNHMNIILASNHRTAVSVSDTDRRFNAGEYQETRLMMTDAEVARIADELYDFTAILYQYDVVEKDLRSPAHSKTRTLMQELTGSAFHNTTRYLRSGQMQELIDMLPSERSPATRDGIDRIALDDVKHFFHRCEQYARRSETMYCSRDDIHIMLALLNPETVAKSTSKFVQQVKHYGIFFERHEGELVLPIMWEVPECGVKINEKALRSVK